MKKFLFLLIVIALFSFNCTDDSVKPSPDSQLATQAFNNINMIKDAYEEKNKTFLQNHLDSTLFESVLKNFLFEKAELSFNPRMVRITDRSVTVDINWRGSWWFGKGKQLENRGAANLVLNKDTMKLIDIKGDNPFKIPSIENLRKF
jgi:hypothetical protein